MAGIDILGQFPNSYMAKAVKLGQSRFITGEVATTPGGSSIPGSYSGMFTLNTPGTKTTANLLTAASLSSSFNTLSIAVASSAAGVTIAQGSGSAVYQQGSVVTFTNVSPSVCPVTITMAANDIVNVTYTGW